MTKSRVPDGSKIVTAADGPLFDPVTLPLAVRNLFEANHYEVTGPSSFNGAEVDLIARSLSDPFAPEIYMEITVDYVDNTKYGNDLTKLVMIRELAGDARLLIVSSKGFTVSVRERAEAARIQTITYDELFRGFERFDRYVSAVCGGSREGIALAKLESIYEEPQFRDAVGEESATAFLTSWLRSTEGKPGWIVVTGEYGTGKTALTKVLQHRWVADYKKNPSLPIPFRIELRDFVRQFDATGLLHHFLDANDLGHVPVDFVWRLLRSGRIVLILDGYDEMAQYLNARERRTCLQALAELSAEGARGILTSRPNYFTEAEELRVFEILYRSLSAARFEVTAAAASIVERERRVDELLAQFINRYERVLQDLTEPQTEALVCRILADDPTGRDVILNLLRRIFRNVASVDSVSLSGKPVIVSFLLQVVEGLKARRSASTGIASAALSEWDIYTLILDQLMLRDLVRSPEVKHEDRREFLRRLSIRLSRKEHPYASEELIRDEISKQFKLELARLAPDARAEQLERYAADLRSSATLTRDPSGSRSGWRFSHNSLREYLVSEYLLARLLTGQLAQDEVPITDAMRMFVASKSRDERARHREELAQVWKRPSSPHAKGAILSLLWDGIVDRDSDGSRQECLEYITGRPVALEGIVLSRTVVSSESVPTDLVGASLSGSSLSSVDFSGADLSGADFSDSALEGVRFCGARLAGAKFKGALLVDVDLSGADLDEANFEGVDRSGLSLIVDGTGVASRAQLEGDAALGYLRYRGARVPAVADLFVYRHHPRFDIVEKVLKRLGEQPIRQRRGLEQRGAARSDVTFARELVAHLERSGLIETPRGRKDQVAVTEKGRAALARFVREQALPPEVVALLQK